MQYIIMSNGKGTRWNNYLGITKQEVLIENERLLDRTVRLIHDRCNDKILISSSNAMHENANACRIISKYSGKLEKQFAIEYLTEETTYLYGDTYYTEKAMDIIMNDIIDEIIFYGNENAIAAIKAQNYELYKKVILNADENCKSLYHEFDTIDHLRKFISLGTTFYNINTSQDYENLLLKVKTLK